MDYMVRRDQKVKVAHPESKETQVRTEFVVNLDPPVKMVLKENQEYPAEMVSKDYPAPQDSKANLEYHI
jgi:hypothetical protein